MAVNVSVNLSRDKMHSNYDSVVEQTGIFAGKGGFDITTGEHTQLNGAVIGSTATADRNKLDTGTLGFSDIHNQADYKVEHQVWDRLIEQNSSKVRVLTKEEFFNEFGK